MWPTSSSDNSDSDGEEEEDELETGVTVVDEVASDGEAPVEETLASLQLSE